MERFLSSVIMDDQVGGGGQSLLSTIKIAVLPIAKVFTMCFLGFLMASKYVNILPASGRKLLNGLVFTLLLPCLIFSQLGQAITFQKMIEWWFIPFNVVLATVLGSLIGLVVATIVRPPYPFFKFTIIHIGIGNIGNVPLVLIAALCRDKSNPFGDTDQCSRDGTAYLSYGQWVGAIILYTYVFHMLAPPPEGTFDVEEKRIPLKITSPNSTPEQVPLLSQETVAAESIMSSEGKIKDFLVLLYNKLKLKQIIQPPIIASDSAKLAPYPGRHDTTRIRVRNTARILQAALGYGRLKIDGCEPLLREAVAKEEGSRGYRRCGYCSEEEDEGFVNA